MVRKNSESAHHSMVLESLVKVSLVVATLAVAQTQQPQILILLQSTMMGPVSFCLGAPTRLHAITTLTLWKTTVLAWSWMSAVCAAAQVMSLSVVAMMWSPVLAIAMAMSSTIAVFAVVQAFQKELAIVMEMLRTNAAYVEGLGLLRQHVIALGTWPTNVASVAAMDQLVRRDVQTQLPAILILQRSSTMVHANTSPARVAPIRLHAITMKMRP
jgi:hypothetical protein